MSLWFEPIRPRPLRLETGCSGAIATDEKKGSARESSSTLQLSMPRSSAKRRKCQTRFLPPMSTSSLAAGSISTSALAAIELRESQRKKEGRDRLFPSVPQLPRVGAEYTEAQMFWIVKHGIRRTGMFANSKWSTDREVQTPAAYIKRIRSLPAPCAGRAG